MDDNIAVQQHQVFYKIFNSNLVYIARLESSVCRICLALELAMFEKVRGFFVFFARDTVGDLFFVLKLFHVRFWGRYTVVKVDGSTPKRWISKGP